MRKYLSAPAVVSGIVAALFVLIFIEPLMGGVWQIILLFSDQLYFGYIDSIYASASLGIRNHLDFMIITLIVITVFLAAAFLLTVIVVIYREVTNPKEVKNDPIKELKKGVIYASIGFVLILFESPIFLSAIYFDMQLNASFQRRLNALAPALNDQELKEMRASWAQMNSRNDYEMLRATMERVARARGVELPEALVD